MKSKTPTIQYCQAWRLGNERHGRVLRWVGPVTRALRVTGSAADIMRASERFYSRDINRGWYIDPFRYGELAVGYVLQMPSRKGALQFVPAIRDPWGSKSCDSFIVEFGDVFDDKVECARAADGLAEAYAEHEREYQIRESAKMQAEDLRAEAKATHAQARALLAEINALKHQVTGPEVCKALRAQVAKLRTDARAAIARASELDDNPYLLME